MPAEPVFQHSADPTLTAFAALFEESALFTFAADKHLRTGALTPIYDCETQSRPSAEAELERFVVTWAPVWPGTDPVTGFRTGGDSSVLGTAPTVAMPPDERTAALLLLVTSAFVHLSAARTGSGRVVRGALEAEGGSYHFLELIPTDLGERGAGLDRPAALDPAAGA